MKKRINTNPHIVNFVLKKNRNFPNSKLPVLILRQALMLPDKKHSAAKIVQSVFLQHRWRNSWKNGIYDFHHYHSNTHECMAICSGYAFLILGGPGGKRMKMKQGDVIILPAGVAHKCSYRSPDFLCVGAYPNGKDYDTRLGLAAEYKEAVAKIKSLPVPANDPLYGKQGFLHAHWKNLKP